MLYFLYETVPGRFILKFLTRPELSDLCGRFLDGRLSRYLIPGFVKKNNIDLSPCQKKNWKEYDSFNEFFCRRLEEGARPVNKDSNAFIAPCDGLLSIYPIHNGVILPVKQSWYTLADLLKDRKLAMKYDGGTCLVFRLCVNHYHRYGYPDSGVKTENRFIPGVLHTVRPIALRTVPVFTENSREYTILHSNHFGNILQMEVGAMLVGKIANLHGAASVEKGQEKGHFLYGGSTVIVLVEKDQVKFSERLYQKTREGIEVPVKYGQKIGRKIYK